MIFNVMLSPLRVLSKKTNWVVSSFLPGCRDNVLSLSQVVTLMHPRLQQTHPYERLEWLNHWQALNKAVFASSDWQKLHKIFSLANIW